MDSKPALGVDLAAERLGRSSTLVISLFDHLPAELQRWKPSPERWSLLEIVNHLADEEALDFRTRIERTLRDPSGAWPPISVRIELQKLKKLVFLISEKNRKDCFRN